MIYLMVKNKMVLKNFALKNLSRLKISKGINVRKNDQKERKTRNFLPLK